MVAVRFVWGLGGGCQSSLQNLHPCNSAKFDISTLITFTISVFFALKSKSGSSSFTSFERNARLNAVHAIWSRWFVRTIRRTRIEPWTSILEQVRLCRSLFLVVSMFCSLMYLHPCVGLHRSFIIGVVIWACLDPTNFFAPPSAVPWIIGLT